MAECRTRVGQWLTVAAIVALFAPACGEMSADEGALEDGGAGASEPDGGTGGSGETGGVGGSAGSAGTGGAGGAGMGGTGASAGSAGEGGSLTMFSAEPTTFLIHNAPDTFPVRICLEIDGVHSEDLPYPSDFDNPMPLSNRPGIPVGGAWNLDELLEGIDPTSNVTFHLLDANSNVVIQGIGCKDLVNSLLPSFKRAFESVNITLLTKETVRALVLEGCNPGSTLSTTQCGEDFTTAEGNLVLRPIGVSPALFIEPSTHVYPFHLSPSLAALGPGVSFPLTYGTLGEEPDVPIEGTVPRNQPTLEGTAFTPPSELSSFGEKGFSLEKRDPATTSPEFLLQASLANIQRVTSPNDTPDAFFTGAGGFLLVFLGDIDSQPWLDDNHNWNTEYNGQGFHLLALPFQFTLPEDPP